MRTSAPRTESSPQQGFTLVEVLVALVILALFSAVLSKVLQGGLQVRQIQKEESAQLDEETQARALFFSGEEDGIELTLEPVEDPE